MQTMNKHDIAEELRQLNVNSLKDFLTKDEYNYVCLGMLADMIGCGRAIRTYGYNDYDRLFSHIAELLDSDE